MPMTFLFIIEMIGAVAAAISGIRLASVKRFDWFGAYIVGLVTALGGGTLRDVLLDITVFWTTSWDYFVATGVAMAIVLIFQRQLVRRLKALLVFDAIGLALFTVIGIEKSLMAGRPIWVAIAMGLITGAFGGVLRDILINEEPLIFRKDIYAMASFLGGVVYGITFALGGDQVACGLSCAGVCLTVRMLALRYSWHLPIMHPDNE
ncbi:MAG: trimeric intracellular cation channel family protein [Muribaculaceae bacterium]|nr:trimeric intracellular cation channel family protein [Muribaculaceae bacterium]